MCIYNTMIKNRKYTKNKKNGGVIPHLTDRRIEYVPTKCGKCIECRKQYSREWLIRLLEHIKTHKNGKFIAFTFSNESIAEIVENHSVKRTNKATGKIERIPIKELKGYEKDNAIASVGIRNFTETWRYKHGNTQQHWFVTELGHNGTENIHIHGIIWTDKTFDDIRNAWKWGFIYPRKHQEAKNYVGMDSITYIVKYLSKVDQRNKEYKAKVYASAGIGKNYINTMNAQRNSFKNRETDETYVTVTGHKIALPTYYRKQLYTEFELEQLWLNRLDEEVRYVLGKKIDMKNGDSEYKAAVENARMLNTQLGYGQRKNKDREEYENQRRELMIMTRIKKVSQSDNNAVKL